MSTERIIELLAESGITAEHRPTSSPDELGPALRDPGDLVVAAGGDGTIRAVALTLAAENIKVPLAIAPLGTANNIAHTLGLTEPTEQLLRGLATPEYRPFDLGMVHGPWGETRFLEAFGLGLFAHGLSSYDPERGKNLFRALRSAVGTLTGYEAKNWQLELDGEDLSGRYLMVELMNTTSMGLRLRLVPDADPSDGCFDLLLVAESSEVGLSDYVGGLFSGTLEELPNVTIKRGRTLKLQWDGSPLHFDEELRGKEGGDATGSGPVTAELLAGAVELYLPKELASHRSEPELAAPDPEPSA